MVRKSKLGTLDIYRAYPANTLSSMGRARVYVARLWEFVAAESRESEHRSGVFPPSTTST